MVVTHCGIGGCESVSGAQPLEASLNSTRLNGTILQVTLSVNGQELHSTSGALNLRLKSAVQSFVRVRPKRTVGAFHVRLLPTIPFCSITTSNFSGATAINR